MSNIGYGMDMLCSNGSKKVTEILKCSNKKFQENFCADFSRQVFEIWDAYALEMKHFQYLD